MRRVPFSVQQKLLLFNNDTILLKQFLISKNEEEREVYQEFLSKKRRQVKYVPMISICANVIALTIEPIFGVLVLPLQFGPLMYMTHKYEMFENIQKIFNEVDVESKN